MQQTEKYWSLINRFVLASVVVMAVIGIALAFAPKVKQMREYQHILETKQERIDYNRASAQKLKEMQRRFKSDPAFVEKVAHEVGYAGPDEIIYHFPEESGATNGTR